MINFTTLVLTAVAVVLLGNLVLLAQDGAPTAVAPAPDGLLSQILHATPELAAFLATLYLFLRHISEQEKAHDAAVAAEREAHREEALEQRKTQAEIANRAFTTLDGIVDRHGKALEKVGEHITANTSAITELRSVVIDRRT